MHAIVLTEPGSADNFELRELPDPVAGPGELLIAVEAAGIHPVDRSAINGFGDRAPVALPWTLGWDLAGRVVAVGDGVDADAVGRRVLGFTRWFDDGNGTQASLVALGRDHIAFVDDRIPSTELTTFGLNGMTAIQELDAANVAEAGSIIVVGATGGVGGFVVELARDRGLTVHIAGRDTTDAELAELHADALVNTAPTDPTRFLAGVKDGGVAVSVTTPATAERGIHSSRVGVKVDRTALERVAVLAEAGVLTTNVAGVFPAEQAAAAYQADSKHGRIVVTFS